MKILKFGGTSLANAEKFLQVANIIEINSKIEQIAIVLSAPAKITNLLTDIIEKQKNNKNAKNVFKKIEKIFFAILKKVPKSEKNFSYKKICLIIENKLNKLKNSLSGIALLNQCPDSIRAKIICLGEQFSIIIMNEILISKHYQTTIINPVKKILADGNYLNATVNIKTSSNRIRAMKIPKNHIILMAGFTAGNKKGELVTLGRNGSDYSAAILSACLKGSKCEIWTDVNGIYTCDPKKIPEAKLLTSISYNEAMELCYFGAKVLHPKTIAPIQRFNILCTIKNTNYPNLPGTKIYNISECDKPTIKGISYLKNIIMLSIIALKTNKMNEIISRTSSVLTSIGITTILITQLSSENKINFFISSKDEKKILNVLNNEFQIELTNVLLKPIKIIKDLAIISVVSSKNKSKIDILSTISSVLNKIQIDIITIIQGLSEYTISIIIKNYNISYSIRAIHKVLFENHNTVEIFLIGIGGIGKELLTQIKKQQQWFLSKNINLKVCSIANSKKIFINTNGINLYEWENEFNQSNNPFNYNCLTHLNKHYYFFNPTIIDCTSNHTLANHYTYFLKNNFHIVTPNKKANTENWNYYKEIRTVSKQMQKNFFYETNVGAGLPVIENLKNLLKTGDKLIQFRGILSGSLSFIFGKLEENVLLSTATLEAQTLGFTEPNPRDDLSGIDVARKLLILAREIGYNLELENIKIEPLLPQHLYTISDPKEFIIQLKKIDQLFLTKINYAKQQGKKLKFIGTIDNKGHCCVKISAIDKNDPLYDVKNGENALVFYSEYYQPIPLILRGYGAGNKVTASGVFSDILKILPYNI